MNNGLAWKSVHQNRGWVNHLQTNHGQVYHLQTTHRMDSRYMRTLGRESNESMETLVSLTSSSITVRRVEPERLFAGVYMGIYFNPLISGRDVGLNDVYFSYGGTSAALLNGYTPRLEPSKYILDGHSIHPSLRKQMTKVIPGDAASILGDEVLDYLFPLGLQGRKTRSVKGLC